MSQPLEPVQQSAFNDERVDRWIFGGALFFFIASTLLIVDDRILFRNGAGSGEPIAKLYRKDNDVRRRMESDTAFMPVQNADDMYAGDAVFTGDKSEAEIQFEDGGKVNIESGSLVVLQLSKDNPKISIEKGTISGKLAAGKTLAIVTGNGKEAELKGGTGAGGEEAQIQISVDRGQPAQITVLSGKAELASGTGETVQLDKLQAATMSAEGKLSEPIKYSIELNEPKPDRQIWTDGNGIDFKWKVAESKGQPEYLLEVARDRDFKEIEYKKKLTQNEVKVTDLPESGVFYWRVSAEDRSAEDRAVRTHSPVGRILLLHEKPPAIVGGPEEGQAIKVLAGADKPQVDLKWGAGSEGEPLAAKYQVELYKENKESLLTQAEVSGAEWKTPKLEPGQYYWRVKAQDPTRRNSSYSKFRSFEVTEDIAAAPVALRPESGQKYLKKTGPAPVAFEWKTESIKPKRHILEISTDEDFKDGSRIVLRKELSDSQFEWQAAQLGTFYWRTRSVDSDGAMTAFTKPSEFEVTPWEALEALSVSDQKLNFTLGKTEKIDQQKLEWDRNKAVSKYEVEISDTPNFTAPKLKQTTDGNFFEWPDSLKPTKRTEAYFRIRGQVGAEDWTAWSEPAKIDLRVDLADLDEPEGISPKGGQELEVDPARAPPVEIQWTAVEGASGYEIQVSSKSDFDSGILQEAKTRDPVFKLKNAPLGKTFWRVRSRNAFTQSDWAGPYAFNRTASADTIVLPAPVLVHPVGRVFTHDEDELDFRWEGVEGARQYEITLMRKPGTGSPLPPGMAEPPAVLRYRVDGTDTTIKMPKDGSYTWKIRASAARRQLGQENVTGDGRSLASTEKGGGSSANFDLIRSPIDTKRPGYLALSTMVAPYEYRFQTSLQNGSARADSSALTLSIRGEYWMRSRWGLGATMESTAFSIGDRKFLRSSFQLIGKHRIPLDEQRGWHLAPFAGVEGRQYFEITPLQFKQFWTYGAAAGFELRKTLTEKFSANFRMTYFYPFMVAGLPDGSNLTSEASTRNVSVGMQGYYWFMPQLGVGVGGFLDFRSISYRTPTSGLTGSERIFTDGSYFYTSLMYRFGY